MLPALRVQRLVGRIGIQINVQICLDILLHRDGETLSQKQEEIRVRLTNEEQRLQEKIQGYNEITARVLAQSEQVEEQRNEMFSLHSRAVSKRSEAASMESYRTSLQKRKEQLFAEGAEQEQSTRAFEADQKKDLAEQEAAAARAQRMASAMEQLKQERADLMRVISEEAKKLDDTRIRVSQLAARKKTIEEMEHNYEGYNGAVRFVMKAGMPGIEGAIWALIFGVIFTTIGFLDSNLLNRANSFQITMFALMMYVFDGLKDCTPEMLKQIIGPMLILIVIGVAGMALFSFIIAKILKMSFPLAFANGLTALYGFPCDAIITESTCNGVGQTEDERKYLLSKMFPSMVVGGFITVTITSVFIAGAFAKLL